MSQMTVTTHGTDITLEVHDSGGAGRPIVLIHGWPLTHESWAAQIGPLQEAGYRVVSYDRRGFGSSDKPTRGYDYDTLSDDLAGLLDVLDLHDVTLVGFSMGGGEVARYVARHGQDRLRSVVFAAAVPPFLLLTDDNPHGAIDRASVDAMKQGFAAGREEFFAEFAAGFFTANGEVKATDEQLHTALRQGLRADEHAAIECIEAFATTDFRTDLAAVTVPTLVIHGAADATVPFEKSGIHTAQAIDEAQVRLIDDAPHALIVSHPAEFNLALMSFLQG